MGDNDNAVLHSFLQAHTTLSLASCDASTPWVCSLFYVADAACRLYYLSSTSVLHSQQIAQNPTVAAVISGQASDWSTLSGVQLVGRVDALPDASRQAAQQRYLARFPQISRMLTSPDDAQQALIAERLLASQMYCLTPSWARLMDNSKGFGHKQVFTFNA